MGTTEGTTHAAIPRWWRLAAVVWMAVWVPSYAITWGWRNFFALCDVALILAVVGILSSHRLLLSSQALASLVVGLLWLLDIAWRLVIGRHLFGGTEYMWDGRVSLFVRLLSLFHLVLPVVLVTALRRTGYDRRALAFQTAVTAALMVVSRLVGEYKNLNYAFFDPLWHRQLGPVPVHLLAVTLGTALLVYLPAHLVLARKLGR